MIITLRYSELEDGVHHGELLLGLGLNALLLLKLLPVQLHLDVFKLGGNHVGGHIRQVLLDLCNLINAETLRVWLIVHLEILYVLKSVVEDPCDRSPAGDWSA